jgi:resuscitation-promoting factor RpfB
LLKPKKDFSFRGLFSIGLIGLGILLIGLDFVLPVSVRVNDRPRTVQGVAFTVSDVLRSAGIAITSADRIQPPPQTWLLTNTTIQVDLARPVTIWHQGKVTQWLTPERDPGNLALLAGIRLYPGDRLLANGLPAGEAGGAGLPLSEPVFLQYNPAVQIQVNDAGVTRSLSSAAETLGQALWQAGLQPAAADQVSPPLDTPLHPGMQVEIRRARALTLTVGDVEVPVRSAAVTVGQALAAAQVPLQGLDYSQPAEDQPIPADGRIRVVRVTEQVLLQQKTIPYKNTFKTDDTLETDQRRVITPGKYGVQATRERVRFEDGKEVKRTVEAEWTASTPQDQVVGLGSKVVVHSADTPDGTIEYWRTLTAYATSYSPCNQTPGSCSKSTTSGTLLQKGVVAVTLSWYHLLAGTRVYIPGYGFGVIADVGGGIPGTHWIDLGYSEEDYIEWHQNVTVYLLTPAPASAPPLLP